MKKLLLYGILFLFLLPLVMGATAEITLTDKYSGSPIENVEIERLDTNQVYYTNNNGHVSLEVADGSSTGVRLKPDRGISWLSFAGTLDPYFKGYSRVPFIIRQATGL